MAGSMLCPNDSGIPEGPGGVVFLIIRGVVDVLLLICVFAGNSIIIFAILRYHRKLKLAGSLPCPNYASIRLVLSLATADIFVAFSTIYFLLFEYSCAVFTTLGTQRMPCLMRYVPYTAAATVSCLSVLALAVDRYIAIIHAMRYRDIMTRRVTTCIVLSIWFSGIATGSSLLFWNNWGPGIECVEYRIIPVYFISVISICVGGTTVCVLAYLHWRVHCVALESNSRKQYMGSNHTSHKEPQQCSMTTKSAQTIYLIVGCVLVLWSPLAGAMVARGQGYNSPALDVFYSVAVTIYNSSYVMNSFIYSWKNATIKMAVLQMFGHQRRKESMVSVKSVSVLHQSIVSGMTEVHSSSSIVSV